MKSSVYKQLTWVFAIAGVFGLAAVTETHRQGGVVFGQSGGQALTDCDGPGECSGCPACPGKEMEEGDDCEPGEFDFDPCKDCVDGKVEFVDGDVLGEPCKECDDGEMKDVDVTLTLEVTGKEVEIDNEDVILASVAQEVMITATLTNESDEDVSNVSVTFNFGDGQSVSELTNSHGVATVTHTYIDPGEYDVTAEAEECGEDEKKVIAIAISITEVWSDQLPGRSCNKLPQNAGTEALYMMVGARSDNRLYLKARINIEPEISELHSYIIGSIAERHPPDYSYEPTSHISSSIDGDVLSLITHAGHLFNRDTEYIVVAGVDYNGNGVLDSDEVMASPGYPFRPVHQEDVEESLLLTGQLQHADVAFPIASGHITAFIYGESPALATSQVNSTISAGHPDLEHHAGLNFNTNCTSHIYDYHYNENSYVSQQVRQSNTLKTAIINQFVSRRLEVIASLAGNPSQNQFHFSWPLPVSTLAYEFDSWDFDLHYAFGKVRLASQPSMSIEIERTGTASGKVTQASISGTQTDLYDWHYEYDPIQAVIQTGHPTIPGSGQIYKNTVTINGSVDTVIDYPFDP